MPDPAPAFRHVLLTRFNTRPPGSPAPAEAWLRDRMRLFEQYCVPSVRRQTAPDFQWLVFADATTPQWARHRLGLLRHQASFRLVFLDEPFSTQVAARAITELALDRAPYLITSRLDNDDAIAPHFIASVQRAFRPTRLEFLNLPLGYQLATDRVFLRPYLASSFASLVEERTGDPWRTVYAVPHHLIGRYPTRQLWSGPAWLQVVHGRNLANEVRGIPVAASTAAALFDLGGADLAEPSATDRVVGALRFVVRGLSTADARSRATSVLPGRHRGPRPAPTGGPGPDEPATPLVVAILTCHDRRELTLRALRGWFGQRAVGARLEAVLVDDGSTDGTAAAVAAEFPEVTVLPGTGSLFWAAGMALAEAHARRRDPDALVWLNDDVLLDEDGLARLRTVSASSTPPAVVAGALVDPDTGRPSYGAFARARWHPLRGSLVAPGGRPVPVAAVHGNVLYVPRAAYRRLTIDGGFEHAYADFDYGLRLREIGYPVLLTPEPVGRCSRAHSSRRGTGDPGRRLRDRLAELNSPRGVPWRSHLRYLRRHGGPLWPVFVPVPYVKEVLRTPVRLPGTARLRRLAAGVRRALSIGRRHAGAAEHPVRFLLRLAGWRIRTALGADAVVPFRHYGLRFWCPSEWRGMSKLAYTLRDEYEPELPHLARWTRPGDLVVDVGAHYGAYTVCLAAAVGPDGHVLAVEPAAHARAVLDRNLRLNGLSTVRVVGAALGERPDRLVLHHHADRSRAALAGHAAGGADPAGGEEVRVVRLDDVVPAGRRVAFVKIDVEGYELPALRGAAGVLTRDRPVVLFEYQAAATDRVGLPAAGAWDLLAGHGYRFRQVRADGTLVEVRHPAALTGQNVLAVPS